MRIEWDKYEAALLLHYTIQVYSGNIERKIAVKNLSALLRNKALKSGIKIDIFFRNVNGISLMMEKMHYIFENGKSGLPGASKLYMETVSLYKNNYDEYISLVKKGFELCNSNSNVESDNQMTIVDACIKVLEEAKSPLTYREIYNEIEKNNLYKFGAKEPADVVRIAIARNCKGFSYSENNKNIFAFKLNSQNDKVYYLLDNEQTESEIDEPQEPIKREIVRKEDTLLDYFNDVVNDYPELIFTNYDATNVLQRRCVYIFPKNVSRRGNVIFEIWAIKNEFEFRLFSKRKFFTKEENDDVDANYERATQTRGRIDLKFTYRDEFISYFKQKLDMVKNTFSDNGYTQNNKIESVSEKESGDKSKENSNLINSSKSNDKNYQNVNNVRAESTHVMTPNERREKFLSKTLDISSPTGKYFFKYCFLNIEKYCVQNNLIYASLFEIDNKSKFQKISEQIKSDDKFKKHNRNNWELMLEVLNALEESYDDCSDAELVNNKKVEKNNENNQSKQKVIVENEKTDSKANSDPLKLKLLDYEKILMARRGTYVKKGAISFDELKSFNKDIRWGIFDNLTISLFGKRASEYCEEKGYLKNASRSTSTHIQEKRIYSPLAEKYENWLLSQNLKPASCKSYISGLISIEEYAKKSNYDPWQLFSDNYSLNARTVNKLLTDNKYLAEHTSYRSVLVKYLSFLGYDEEGKKIKSKQSQNSSNKEIVYPQVINEFKRWLLYERNLKINTCKSYITSLMSIEKYTKDNGYTSWQLTSDDYKVNVETINQVLEDTSYLSIHTAYRPILTRYLSYLQRNDDDDLSENVMIENNDVEEVMENNDVQPKYDEYLETKSPLLYRKLYSVSKVYDEPDGLEVERIFKLVGHIASEAVLIDFLDKVSWATKVGDKKYSFSSNAVPMNETEPENIQIVTQSNEEPKDFVDNSLEYDKEKFIKLLSQRFDSGITLDSIDIEKFRMFYSDLFDEEINLSDEELSTAISECGLSYKGKIFAAESIIDSDTREKLHGYVENAFALGKKMIYYKAIYSDMENDFICCFNLADDKMLKEYMKYSFSENGYYFSEDYISKDKDVKVNNTAEIEEYLLNCGKPVDFEMICSALSHIPSQKIDYELHINAKFISNANKEYFHESIFEISEGEKETIKAYISEIIEDKGYATWTEVFDKINSSMPVFVENNIYLSALGIRKCVSNELLSDFDFKNNVISKKGDLLNRAEIFKRYARNHETFTLDELMVIAEELGGNVPFEAFRFIAVRINHDTFISRKNISIDVNAVDNAIESYISGSYILINQFDSFVTFPTVGYEWNEYLLENFLLYYSNRYSLLSTGQSNNRVTGIVTLINGGISSLIEACSIALAESDCELKKDKALAFLSDRGYITRRRYSDIEEVIKRASIMRNRKES